MHLNWWLNKKWMMRFHWRKSKWQYLKMFIAGPKFWHVGYNFEEMSATLWTFLFIQSCPNFYFEIWDVRFKRVVYLFFFVELGKEAMNFDKTLKQCNLYEECRSSNSIWSSNIASVFEMWMATSWNERNISWKNSKDCPNVIF